MLKKVFSFKFLYFGGLFSIVLLMSCSPGTQMGYMTTSFMPVSTVTSIPPFSVPRDLYHEVAPSETIWRISKTYDVDTKTILRTNRLKDANKLKTGQRLLIPKTLGPRAVIPLYPTRKWTYIVVHHTATEEGNARTIDIMHHERGFWNGMGYHFLIDNGTNSKMDGQIEVGSRWVKQEDGAHANTDGMNQKGIGVSLVGNFSSGSPSKAQFDSLVFIVKTLQEFYHIPDDHVIGHRDVLGKSTECPGLKFPWAEFKRRLR